MKILLSTTLFTLLILYTNINYAQRAKCSICNGTGLLKEYIDPQECQNCVDWNESYRSKVACHVCKDTRLKAYRRTRTITCKYCKGTGRDFEEERRMKEFGDKKRILSSNSYVTVDGLITHAGNWRSYYGGDYCVMNYTEAVELCRSLGDGWRLPTIYELAQLFDAQSDGRVKLKFIDQQGTGNHKPYFTSTPHPNYQNKPWGLLNLPGRGGYAGYIGYSRDLTGYYADGLCQCVKSK
jgi:hypothetical protein